MKIIKKIISAIEQAIAQPIEILLTPAPLGCFTGKTRLLVLIRHGPSEANKQGILAGALDYPLAPEGEESAQRAGNWLQSADLWPTVLFETDRLRSQQTSDGILKNIGISRGRIRVIRTSSLNERDYGEMQGRRLTELRHEMGVEALRQVIWGFNMKAPGGESLQDTSLRVRPCLQEEILPQVANGEVVLVSSHLDTIRAMIMHLDNLTADEIAHVDVPWTVPIIYEFDSAGTIVARYIPGFTKEGTGRFAYYTGRFQRI